LSIVIDERSYEEGKVNFAVRRGSELADEFTRLEVQIATIMLAFAGLFFEPLTTVEAFKAGGAAMALRWFYAGIIVFLVGSLLVGLVHIKRKESWWGNIHRQRVAMAKAWRGVLDGSVPDIKTARANVAAIICSREHEIQYSPKWTWILQTIFLGIAIGFILVLFLIIIFV